MEIRAKSPIFTSICGLAPGKLDFENKTKQTQNSKPRSSTQGGTMDQSLKSKGLCLSNFSLISPRLIYIIQPFNFVSNFSLTNLAIKWGMGFS